MSVVPAWRAFALRGPDRELALEWLHVHGNVLGVLEEDHAMVVWLPRDLPAMPTEFQVVAEERAVRPEDFTVTGLENDKPIYVAADLMVRPPWVRGDRAFSGIELIVPRGGAFGSGEHDSTQVALVVMHRAWSSPSSMADVGTGSGILALYAHVRGCQRIEACDIDEPSVVAARQLLASARICVGGAEQLAPCDLVVANMTGTELRGELSAILSIWTREHELVLSGLRAHEVDDLIQAVPARPTCRETLGAFTAVAFRAI